MAPTPTPATAIFHLVLPSLWAANPEQDYRADSLDGEGFIHCSFARQVAWAANRFYADENELFVLQIDPLRLRSPMKVETPSGGGTSSGGQLFPHIYGPINRDAVVAVHELRRDGRTNFWVFEDATGRPMA